MYRIIINTGNVHNAKALAYSIEDLQKEVEYALEIGHTIVEVQIKINGEWRNT